ncbi:MAG TPA: hypothetical protein VLM75_02685 [Spirochaetota bacterium]|nr:hypothetical protein [Spirochaetota bacterium]
MYVKKLFISMIALLYIPFSRLHADIIVTKDDMVLNGKILEKKTKQIIFGNYHGVFIIDMAQIKEIHETDSYKEDLSIFEKKGKRVDENEVKNNYRAGLERAKDRKLDKGGEKIVPVQYTLMLTPFYIFNAGKLGGIMPHSSGVMLTADVPLKSDALTKWVPDIKNTGITGIRSEVGYFTSKKGVKSINGPRVSSGPVWEFPFSIGDIRFMYTISPVLGIGHYTVENRYKRVAALKWHAGCITGPTFVIHNAVVFPQIRLDYIYDGSVPLYGMGLGIGLGYRFSI